METEIAPMTRTGITIRLARRAGRAAIPLAAVLIATGAAAHALDETRDMLGDREKFFQAVDKPAPAFALRDADGRPVGLEDLRDKVVVLHFVYARCPDVCPLHAEKLAEVQAMINRTPMKALVRFVTITTDPRRDTAEVMRNYGPQHGLDPVNWTFLTTTPDQPEDATRKLAQRFGHEFTKVGDDYQMHSVVTHVIDREGRWRANFHGLRFEPANFVVFVNALVNDLHPPHRHKEPGLWERMKDLVR